MTQTDQDFFDEYKRLDKLCSEMFGVSNSGVTAYLTEMEHIPVFDRHFSDDFEESFQRLKEIRHKRASLAHDVGVNDIATDEDLVFTVDFYERILSGEDPLHTIASKKRLQQQYASARQKQTVQTPAPKPPAPVITQTASPQKRESKPGCLIYVLLLVLFILAIVLIILAVG